MAPHGSLVADDAGKSWTVCVQKQLPGAHTMMPGPPAWLLLRGWCLVGWRTSSTFAYHAPSPHRSSPSSFFHLDYSTTEQPSTAAACPRTYVAPPALLGCSFCGVQTQPYAQHRQRVAREIPMRHADQGCHGLWILSQRMPLSQTKPLRQPVHCTYFRSYIHFCCSSCCSSCCGGCLAGLSWSGCAQRQQQGQAAAPAAQAVLDPSTPWRGEARAAHTKRKDTY
jgi:hypothetical protein